MSTACEEAELFDGVPQNQAHSLERMTDEHTQKIVEYVCRSDAGCFGELGRCESSNEVHKSWRLFGRGGARRRGCDSFRVSHCSSLVFRSSPFSMCKRENEAFLGFHAALGIQPWFFFGKFHGLSATQNAVSLQVCDKLPLQSAALNVLVFLIIETKI